MDRKLNSEEIKEKSEKEDFFKVLKKSTIIPHSSFLIYYSHYISKTIT